MRLARWGLREYGAITSSIKRGRRRHECSPTPELQFSLL
jgi:hypothetical protein